MTINLSPSLSDPMSSVMICWNTVVTALNMSFRDELFPIGSWTELSVESYFTTQPVSLEKSTHLRLTTRVLLLSDSCGFVDMEALSLTRGRASFTIAGDPRQRSHSRVRVPWDSRPYFTASDSRLPLLSPPTTRRATVEVFDPASKRD
jgi:hypothetical protein